jgi:chromosome segregation protein
MPPRLKSFELHGYKTFASRSEFVFSEGITAIVGPNGSGKSNIADALRWVLGEQSYGLLRAKKTEDMIFSGSENRSRAGMAAATIVFDNSDGWLPIDFTEVGITRRAYRDGENEYLLNGQRVRLKDVSEVLAKSGLAERTYTIIGQGLVDAALALKAEERRRLFEEAAGIGLHRSRREETLKRLETTRRNLERVQDILAELQPRLRSLERQAKRAQEYNQMKSDLKVVLHEWYGYHWHKAQSELVTAQVEAKQKESVLLKVQESQLNLDQQLRTYRSDMNDIRSQLTASHQELTSLHQRREALNREMAVSIERSRMLVEQLEQLSVEKLKLDEDIAKQKDQIAIASQDVVQLDAELTEARQAATDSAETLTVRQNERLNVEKEIQELDQKIRRNTSQSAQLEARISEKESHITRLEASILKLDGEHAVTQEELHTQQARFAQIALTRDEKVKTSKAIQLELNVNQEKTNQLERDRKEILEKISSQKALVAKVQAEINVLEEAEQNLTGYGEGAKILLKAVKENRLAGAVGSLGNSLAIPEEYESAIAAVLGEYVDSLILESLSQSDNALDLIESETVRGSLFPLDAISQVRPISLALDKAPVDAEQILGVASHLIEADPKLRPVIDLLLGQVIVVKDRKTARDILASGDWHKLPNFRVVTLHGEVYLSSGPIIKGASRKGLLVRPRQRRESKSVLEKAVNLVNDYEARLDTIEQKQIEVSGAEKILKERYKIASDAEKSINQELHQLELAIEKLQRNIQWHQDQKASHQQDIQVEQDDKAHQKSALVDLLEEVDKLRLERDDKSRILADLPIEELQAQSAYWKTNTAVIEQAMIDARNRQIEKTRRLHQLEMDSDNLSERTKLLELEINELDEKISHSSTDEGAVGVKIEELTRIVEPLETQLDQLESEHNALLTSDSEARQILRGAEQQYTQSKISLAHHQEAFETLRGHIEDDFGLVAFDYTESVSGPKPLPLDGMVESLPKVEHLPPELEETIRQQKAQIRRMGAINPEAESEFREVKERYEFLTSQIDDLTRAEIDIREVIAELDMLMEREFQRTFDAVAQEFKQIFTRLFGGGSARLALTDPENITDTGIDIEARLPGRREQGLALLSGGERSLTAVALVFALLRVAPTPFCILDEVDAMLDEANVARFRDLLTELSEKTQFIVITHNRNTVQAASIIYGVTMGRDSASQVISLHMDELGEEFGV